MNRRVFIGWMVVGLTAVYVSMAMAQSGGATPLDGMFNAVMTSIPLWGRVIISVGGVGLAGGILYMLHAGPIVLLGLVIGFAALAVIGMASNGTLAAWFGV